MPPIFMFMGAAALIAGGLEALDLARKAKARDEALRTQEAEADILRGEIALEELRALARERGLDPDAVVAGYRAMRRGEISPEDLLRALEVIPGGRR